MNLTSSVITEFFILGGQYSNKKGVVIRYIDQTFYISISLIKGDKSYSEYELFDKISGAGNFMERIQ